jgi:type I restriction enzyme S subunit
VSHWNRYPKYKPSGTERLGEVPEGWDIKRIKNAIYLQRGYDLDSTKFIEGHFPVCGSNGIIGYHNEFKTLGPGITIGRSGSVGEVNYIESDFWPHNTAIYIKKFVNAFPRFIFYLLKIIDLKSISSGSVVGTLNRNYIHELSIGLPPLPEQHAIAAFLDRETAHIDALIVKKKRQIELLREKRAALISHVVTKGLDPNAKMKDSGIPSYGEIPAHWTILRNKWLFTEIDDRSKFGDEELLTVSHITGVTPRSEKEVNMFMAETLEGYKKCGRNDLAINTMWAFTGALGFCQCDGIVSPSYNVYRLIQNYFPKYFDYFYRTPQFTCEITRYSKGIWTSRLRLYPEAFLGISSIVPPDEEQKQIVQHIDSITNQEKIQLKKIQDSITLLQEYRSTLISSAVTGKIDVRQEVSA